MLFLRAQEKAKDSNAGKKANNSYSVSSTCDSGNTGT